jgi:hypothetical protein
MKRGTSVPWRRVGAGATLALLFAATAPAGAQTVLSAPVGVLGGSASRGESGLAVPLIAEDVFVGIAQSNTAHAIVFPTAAGDVGSRLLATQRYYVEVVTGPLEGERLDVDAAATVAAASPTVILSLGAQTFSTLGVVAPDALAGARVVIRPHLTLGRLQSLFEPGLQGHDHVVFADAVRVLENGEATYYYLRADGATWRRPGSATDHRGKVIPPDASLLVAVRSRAQSWAQSGTVRINRFRKNLLPGFQSFASGFPVDLSPAQIGAFVAPSAPAGSRWTGHNVFLFADQIHLLLQPERPLEVFYLRGDGSTWRSLTRPTNVANQPILSATGMVLLRRVNPDATFAIPRPFGL